MCRPSCRRIRELSRGGRRKSDAIDARATAHAARDADELHAVAADDLTTVIAMLHERRNNLITQRTRTANQLHALFRDPRCRRPGRGTDRGDSRADLAVDQASHHRR
jgi:hypothetical protein